MRYVITVLASTLLLMALGGCANLDAVRTFGKTAALAPNTADAGAAYHDSALALAPYLAGPAVASQHPEIRARQVRATLRLQDASTQYFALLAKLAGEDAFALDQQIDALGKGLDGLAQGDADAAALNAGVSLGKILAKYVRLAAQGSAVRDLVLEGGPVAMRLTERLRAIIGDWKAQVEIDRSSVLDQIETLAMARDAAPLLAQLARDRAAQLRREFATDLRRIDSADAALERVQAAHGDLAANLSDLSGAQLRGLLKQAVADLRAAKADVDASH